MFFREKKYQSLIFEQKNYYKALIYNDIQKWYFLISLQKSIIEVSWNKEKYHKLRPDVDFTT